MKDQFSAQILQQKERKHEGNHAAVSDQDQDTEQTNHKVFESPGRKKRNDRLGTGGRQGVEWDSVGGNCHKITVEDAIQAHGNIHEHEQGKEPERELMPTIAIVDMLGNKRYCHVPGRPHRDRLHYSADCWPSL
jgi:hypothetical protein